MCKQHHVRLLGPPELIDPDGYALHFRTRKQLALLIYLALETRSEPASRELLADLFWPDAGQSNALHSLSQGLTEIRKRLGTDSLNANRTHVQLLAQLCDDLVPRNPAMSTGQIATPLEGLENCAGRRFADWVERTRDRIRTKIRARLSEELSEARTDGKVLAVHERAELLYKVDPHSDAAVQALAEERFSSGDWAGGIRLVRKHISDSERDLGRSPSADVLATLRRFERGLLRDPVNGGLASGESRNVAIRPQVFVGRESEMARLQALLYDVEAGSFRTCALKGPDGIGKSAILRRFSLSAATRSVPTYRVDCQEIGQNIPFAAVSDLLDHLARDPALSGTDPIWLAEASRIAPRIRVAYPGIPEPLSTAPETVRLRLAEAIKEMLEVVADGCPVLVAFDDMHYMDPASRDVLHVLARRLADSATLLLATVRCTEPDIALSGVDGLKGVEWEQCLNVGPLEEAVLEDLAIALSNQDQPVDKPTAVHIVQMAQGHPYLVEMLVADWRDNGPKSLVSVRMTGSQFEADWDPPDTIRSAFAKQYQGLSLRAERIVHLLATAGRSVSTKDIRRLLSVSSGELSGSVFELIDLGIVCLDGNALAFKNEMHRTFVYYAMQEETRKYQHAHLGQYLRNPGDPGDFQNALEASHHFLKAGWVDEALELACLGADHAIRWGAPKEAKRALEAAIAANPQEDWHSLHLLLSRALVGLGKYQEALEAIEKWRPKQAAKHEKALAACVRAEALHSGRLDDDATIKRAVECALSLAEESGDDSLFVSALQLSAELASEIGDAQTLGAVRARTKRIRESSRSTTTKALAHLSQGYCLLIAGDATEAQNEFQSCIKTFTELHLDPELRRAYNGIGITSYCLGAMEDSVSAFQSAIELASRIGDSVASATSWSNLGVVHEDLGNFPTAEGCYDRALVLCETTTNPRRAVEFHLNIAGMRIVSGDVAGARRLNATAREWAERSRLWWLVAEVLLAEADTCVAERNFLGAWSLLEEAQRTMMGRVYALSNLGRFERLKRHHAYVTQGLQFMQHIADTTDLERECVQLTARLEIRAFEEWARWEGGHSHQPENSAIRELELRQLRGVIQRLSALGYKHS